MALHHYLCTSKLIQSRLQCTVYCVVPQVAHGFMSWRLSFRVRVHHECDRPWKHPQGRRHPVAPTPRAQHKNAGAMRWWIGLLRGSSGRQVSQCGLEGGENESFIEQAACIEEQLQELCSLGVLPLEQRVKRRRITGKQPAPGAGRPAEASPGGDCMATPEDKVMPEWKVNKKARVLYAVGDSKGRRMNESYKDRYDK